MSNKTKINIVNYLLQMKRNGRAESTIKRHNQLLTQLSKLCDLNNPEEVKETLANFKWQTNTKRATANILNTYYKFLKIPFEKPTYAKEHKLPFIPTEQEIDLIIASGTPRTATRLQLLKETGARTGEIDHLEWTHIDTARKTIYITAEKGSNSRILPISNKLIAMLNRLPRENNKVFQTPADNFRKTFHFLRRRITKKLHNPRLKKIHLHTFRHFKGTTEYHKTKDIMHVKRVLGHKSIESTILYINIESSIYLTNSDEWTCKATTNTNEATQLIENGFEYVTTTPDKLMLFRKRK
ncbi:MAG: site-specific integrase [Candidatus Bathyarchaeota archaeon]|nr:MAG: site-specific integrase [Candidatus Bathyarchaeota archaeon]